jgi:hypothetical protein
LAVQTASALNVYSICRGTYTTPLLLYFPKSPRCPCPPYDEVSDWQSVPASDPRSCSSFRASGLSCFRSSSRGVSALNKNDGTRLELEDLVDLRLELNDGVDLLEFPLLSVLTRAIGLKELIRLGGGVGVRERGPSSWRCNRCCSCRILFASRSRSYARTPSDQWGYLFLRQLGWSLFQGLGITPSSTISGKERLRGGGKSASILWWKKEV